MNTLFKHYSYLINYGILPEGGGTLNQAGLFTKLLELFPSLEKAWINLAEEKEELLKRFKRGAKT